MNEKGNTALIQNVYAAFARGDVQTILDHLTPDVEWILDAPAVIPFAGRRNGPSQVLKFFEALATTQANQKLTTEEFIAQGDKVATIGRYSAVVKATGKRIDCRRRSIEGRGSSIERPRRSIDRHRFCPDTPEKAAKTGHVGACPTYFKKRIGPWDLGGSWCS